MEKNSLLCFPQICLKLWHTSAETTRLNGENEEKAEGQTDAGRPCMIALLCDDFQQPLSVSKPPSQVLPWFQCRRRCDRG